MNFEVFAGSRLVTDLGWTLLHSLWQIGLVALLLFVTLQILRSYSAQARYLVSVFALAISLFIPVLTFVQIASDATPRTSFSATGARDVRRSDAERLTSDESANVNAAAGGSMENLTPHSLLVGVGDWLDRNGSSFAPVAVGLWLLGVAFFSLRLGGGFSQLRRYRTIHASEVDLELQEMFLRICERVKVNQTVRLLQSALVQTPIAIGVFRPVVLVPASLFLQIHPRELETIIAHELIHIRRYDPVVNIAQCFVETVLFYHPAVWWMSAQVRREREFAADAAVLEVFDGSHVTYARALANLEEIRLRTNQQMPRYATAANGGNFMQRIQRILKIKTEASGANSAWTAGLAFVLTSAFLLAVLSFSSSDLVNAQSRSNDKRLAVGFVSIPPVDRTENPPKDSDATMRLLIQELKEHKVPAIGFLQGNMISDGEKQYPVRANIARLWRDAGFEVGLGGYKHVWLYHTPVDDYIANIEKNERVAKQVLGDSMTPKYFSYPYLNTGKSLDDKARVESWLASHGYTSVKYTFDNNEWMYSYAYDMARNDNDVNTMKEVREAYLAYMAKMFDHYEAYSAEMFGRDIPQTLVLTPSRLVTDTADDFFGMAAKRGYSFVSIDEAQSDEAYRTKDNFTGDAGISWFERWAMAKGTKLLSEPEIDADVQKTWKDRQAAAKK